MGTRHHTGEGRLAFLAGDNSTARDIPAGRYCQDIADYTCLALSDAPCPHKAEAAA